LYTIVAFFVGSLIVQPAVAQEPLTDAKRADILRLLQVTGSGQMALQLADPMVNSITATLKQARPDLPPRVSDIVKEEVLKLMQQRLGSLLNAIIPVYHDNFTHEEIKGLLAFYASPLGKKLIQTGPAVLQQAMKAGQQWGASLGPVIEDRLRARLASEGFK
jgi:hypothetical protein